MKNRTLITAIFFLTLLASFCWHVAFRNDHFQEVDSAAVYQMAHDFPASALHATAIFYPPGHIFSTSTAERILAQSFVRSIKDKHISTISDAVIIGQLTKTSLPAAIRFAFIQATASANLPFPIRTMFALPLSSTYSAGPGLIYGIVALPEGSSISYDRFMSRTLVVTILVFHLAILCLFMILRKLRIGELPSVAISLVALFSISLYSSGLHLGSTVWMLATGFLWIWVLIDERPGTDQKLRDRRISIATAWMIFFNYLIILFWAAYMLVQLADQRKAWKKEALPPNALLSAAARWIWQKAKEQRIAIIFILICGLSFYQAGQGFRGSAGIMELPSYTYYILLNFVSWHAHGGAWSLLQFMLAAALSFFALRFVFSKNTIVKEVTAEEAPAILRRVFFWIIILYAIAVALRTLSFLPTRHMLFLSPLLFIGGAQGIDAFFKNSAFANPSKYLKTAWAKRLPTFGPKSRSFSKAILAISMTAIGFWCLSMRKDDALDLRPRISTEADISGYGIYDSSHDLYYHLSDRGLHADFINPKTLQAGKTYLYVSHSEPFERALQDWRSKITIQPEIIWSSSILTDAYFMAYNPDFAKLRFSRPNNLYQTKFKVISINQEKQ